MLTRCRVDPLRTTTLPHPPGSAKNDQEDVLLPARRSGSRPREPAQLVSLPVVKALPAIPGPVRLVLLGRALSLRSGRHTHESRVVLRARYTVHLRKPSLSPERTTHLHAHWPDSDRCNCRWHPRSSSVSPPRKSRPSGHSPQPASV